MANPIQSCTICTKRVKTHEKIVICHLCTLPSHYQCLPIYSIEDITYANNPNHHWTCPTCLATIFPFNNVENDQHFQHEINSHSPNPHNFETLDQMIFQPFKLNDEDEINDLDPDNNFYNPLNNLHPSSCKYYYPEQLNNITCSKTQNHLSNLTFNIRSLAKNYRQLNILLDSIDTQFHTISLTETWLK